MPRTLTGDVSSPPILYASTAVFLLGALALVVPSGYSIGAVLLLLGSLIWLWRRPGYELERSDWCIIAVLVAYAAQGMIDAGLRGDGLGDMDRPVRFLLVVPVLLFLFAYPPRLPALWGGLAVGALTAGAWAGWQKLAEAAVRAGGHTHLIQYGNLSLMMGFICLAGMGWAINRRYGGWWVLALGLGALGGVLGSVFTGTRGGWLGLPLLLAVLFWGYGRYLSVKARLGVLALIIASLAMVYVIPQTGVQDRIDRAGTELRAYLGGGERSSSVGYRLEMWRGAWQLFLERPVTGWGEQQYVEQMQAMAGKGVIAPGAGRYNHAHNELLDTAAKQGLVGLGLLLALYLVPLLLFVGKVRNEHDGINALALAGMLLPLSYLAFGLTQVPMRHNSGVMMYAFWLVVLWGTLRATERTR
ncbi:O-antigen ligase [Methylohalomonas lacus]|uniref:O-antigen ligase n=1 Tax=Methylohalomonas lacus TaxID=398773 RepID=A0AAE3L2E3_9GAMM|nr:O-antigen ligase family protein [Methylohalomonas lacus]MCS3904391.1 O-antigen ligase [Methylohalomonas lacus]